MDGSKAVLVTGASSGIGRKITERLAGDGYYVYAGARKDSDLHELATIDHVQPLRLDVTSREDIIACVEALKRDRRGLFALVNNAGIATLGAIVDSDDGEFDLVMAVNVGGPYRVTKAFAPLIVAQRGRIVMIGSIAGILAEKNGSAYSMSKHAIEAFTDSLAAEMESLGVQVSVVEPGKFNSKLAKNATERLGADSALLDLSIYKEPDDVASAVALALSEPRPKRRYLVASSKDEVERTLRKQIAQLVELNEGHAHTYDRNTLVHLLDQALAHFRSGS